MFGLTTFFKSNFSKSVLALFTGTALSQALPLLTAPILARLYLPSDYGLFGIFLSTASLVASVATLEFSSGIIVAKDDADASSLVRLSMVLTVLFSLLVLAILLVWKDSLAALLGTPSLANYFLMTPLVIFLQSVNAVFSQAAIRYKFFNLIAVNRFLTAVLSAAVSITAGILFRSFWGLIAGYLVGLAYSSVYLSFIVRKKSRAVVSEEGNENLTTVFRKFINYPKYSLTSGFINNGINQLPIFLLGHLSSTSAVGYYNMNQRILGLPISFVSNSFGEVFRQRASEDFHKNGTCRPIFLKTLKVLILLSIVPFAVLIFWGEEIFAWALGEKWRNAGVYTQALGLMFFFRFIANPLSYVYVIAGNLKGDFLNHIYFFASSLIILYFLIPVSVTTALFVFALNYSLIYIIVLFRSYHLAVNSEFQVRTI